MRRKRSSSVVVNECCVCREPIVQDCVQGVPCTLLCAPCVALRPVDDPESSLLCSKATAIGAGIAKRLDELQFRAARNPHFGGAPPMQLYIRAEVLLVAEEERARERDAAEAQLKRFRKDAEGRRQRLGRWLTDVIVPLDMVDACFGDYLAAVRKPVTLRRHVVARLAKVDDAIAAARHLDIVDRAPVLVFAVENVSVDAHHLARRFDTTRRLRSTVFELVGSAIRPFVSPDDLSAVASALPRLALLWRRRAALDDARLETQLTQAGAPASAARAEASAQRVERYKRYAHDPVDVAARIVQFQTSTVADREALLAATLARHKLSEDADSVASTLCLDFVHKWEDLDVDEVVAMVLISHRLSDLSCRTQWDAALAQTRANALGASMAWMDAARAALQRVLPRALARRVDSMDDDDDDDNDE
jgi:hypothetical protein